VRARDLAAVVSGRRAHPRRTGGMRERGIRPGILAVCSAAQRDVAIRRHEQGPTLGVDDREGAHASLLGPLGHVANAPVGLRQAVPVTRGSFLPTCLGCEAIRVPAAGRGIQHPGGAIRHSRETARDGAPRAGRVASPTRSPESARGLQISRARLYAMGTRPEGALPAAPRGRPSFGAGGRADDREENVMSIQHILRRSVKTLPPETSCREAARLMRDDKIGCVVVAEAGRPCGVVTDRDLVVRVMATGQDAEQRTLAEVMSGAPVFLGDERSLDVVIRTMREEGVRRIPVVDEAGELEGIVTLDDLLVLLGDQIGSLAETVRQEISGAA